MAIDLTYTLILKEAGDKTFTMPSGFESNVEIHCWGGGGGGSLGVSGGGGGYASTVAQIPAGSTVRLQIGQPGANGGLIDSIILPPVNFLTNDSTKIRTFQVGSDTLFTIFGLDSVVEDSFTVWERIKILVSSEHFWMFTLVDIILIVTGITVSFFAFLSIVIKMCKKKDYVLVPHNPVVKSVRQPPIVKNRNGRKQKRIRQQTLPVNIPRLRPAPEMPNNGNFELPVWLMNSDLSLDQV